MKKNADRQLTAIFCDDIRHEMGNKMSFMGCYQGELFIAATPALLPKLCVYASAWTLKGKPFKTLVFRIVQDDKNELARLEIPAQALEEAAQIQDPTATRKTVSTAIAFSPFFIEEPTSLRLMAITEDGEIVGPRLSIKVAPEIAPLVPQAEAKKSEKQIAPKKPRTKKAAVSA